ncbi:MAG TPA: GDP-L-fucose synthase [Polyangia bacterium]|jgi:Nucleoside-diphosphate-sugar epimerases|nr:GDP-L-fucose synthase [Polyangia bacterium]
MEKNSRIYVAGNRGLVGSAIERRLRRDHDTLITSDIADFDLTDARATDAFFARTQPEYVFLAAAKVGGIKANDTYPADFIRINLQIQTNLIDAAFRHKVRKLLFLGSSCIYPKLAPQPLKEEYLLTGKLEPTNDAYAIAKIAGILMCKSYNRQHGTNFVAAMPTNLYGPGDNFDLQTSHVLPAWIRKFHEAKRTGQDSVELWGTGNVRRELLYVEDLADALVFLMNHFDAGREREDEKMFVNIGLGEDIVLRDLAELVRGIVGYSGGIVWNTAMPDGTPRKLLDVGRLHALGWKAQHSLDAGIRKTYAWYLENRATNVR